MMMIPIFCMSEDCLNDLEQNLLTPQPPLLVADIPAPSGIDADDGLVNQVVEEEVEEDFDVVMQMLRASLHSKNDDQFETVDVTLLKKAIEGGLRVYMSFSKSRLRAKETIEIAIDSIDGFFECSKHPYYDNINRQRCKGYKVSSRLLLKLDSNGAKIGSYCVSGFTANKEVRFSNLALIVVP